MSGRRDPGRIEPRDVERGIALFGWLERIPASRRETLLWFPPDDLRDQYPDRRQLVVPFRCYWGADGLRRFSPVGSTRNWHKRERPDPLVFVRWAWAGGLPLLGRLRRLSDDELEMYRMKYFLFLHSMTLKEYYRREFLYKKDLSIPWLGREDYRESVLDWIRLPDCCVKRLPPPKQAEGSETEPKGSEIPEKKADIRSFIAMGRSLAIAEGISRPDVSECLQYGFYAAARHAPLESSAGEVAALIRAALFQFQQTPTLERLEQTWERYWKVYAPHLRDSTEEFNEWLWGPRSSSFRAASKLKRALGGELNINEYRQAVLALGWDAFTNVAECLEHLMAAFAAALPQPMNPRERQLFEQMHLPQPHFGGFPLILLAERFRFCGLGGRPRIGPAPRSSTFSPALIS